MMARTGVLLTGGFAMTDYERRRLELERVLYQIVSDLWDVRNIASDIGETTVTIDTEMAARIRDALGVVE